MRFFAAAMLALLAASPSFAQKRIALSFDDVPRRAGAYYTPDQRTRVLIAALRKAKVKQFLDEGRRDLVKRAAVRDALRTRGLSNGYVTVDNYDWHLDALANAAKIEKKAIDEAALRDLYVETLVGAANFYDKIAREALGRQPAQVMLLHETDLNARMIADVVAGLRADGWEIISIDEAYRDPIAAREPDGWFTNGGRIAALAQETGRLPKDLIEPRADEEVLTALFNERVLKVPPVPAP